MISDLLAILKKNGEKYEGNQSVLTFKLLNNTTSNDKTFFLFADNVKKLVCFLPW